MQNMPNTGHRLGPSSGNNIRFSSAPQIGLRNFQKFSSEPAPQDGAAK